MDNATAANPRRHRRSRVRLSERTPTVHRLGDLATEALLYVTLVFGPWAFGTTQAWSLWTMNITGYVLGLLWLTKWISRWTTGFRPEFWGGQKSEDEPVPFWKKWLAEWPVSLLALLTIVLLAFCFISAINAAGAYDYSKKVHTPFDHYVDWLPHSYDCHRSWTFGWQYLSIALLFWSARDWLLTKTRRERLSGADRPPEENEEHAAHEEHAARSAHSNILFLPAKARRLLWVLCVNGAILAVESLLQRLSGTNRLLWLIEPWYNNDATLQLGPYAYRSNGAQYFNLIWPLCLGFWFGGNRRAADRPAPRYRRGGRLSIRIRQPLGRDFMRWGPFSRRRHVYPRSALQVLENQDRGRCPAAGDCGGRLSGRRQHAPHPHAMALRPKPERPQRHLRRRPQNGRRLRPLRVWPWHI
jgi:hypothetical protein